MVVKELIEILKGFDENLIVTYTTQEDRCGVYPRVIKHNFDTTYWDDGDFHRIPANTEFIEL